MREFYDVVDSSGAVVETAAEQEAQGTPEIPLERQQEPPTPGELKKLRKQYVTIQHPRVVACQHRLNLSKQPRQRNCESCWFAWLQNHGELVQQLDEMHTSGNDFLIVQLQGKKFFKRWTQFMSTIAQWQKDQAAQEISDREINEQAS